VASNNNFEELSRTTWGLFFCNSSSYPTIFDDLIANNLKKIPHQLASKKNRFFKEEGTILVDRILPRLTERPHGPLYSNLCHWHQSQSHLTLQQVNDDPHA